MCTQATLGASLAAGAGEAPAVERIRLPAALWTGPRSKGSPDQPVGVLELDESLDFDEDPFDEEDPFDDEDLFDDESLVPLPELLSPDVLASDLLLPSLFLASLLVDSVLESPFLESVFLESGPLPLAARAAALESVR